MFRVMGLVPSVLRGPAALLAGASPAVLSFLLMGATEVLAPKSPAWPGWSTWSGWRVTSLGF